MKMLAFSAAAICAAVAVTPALALSAQKPAPATAPTNSITRAQIVDKVKERFSRLDANKDGFLTKAELDAAEAAMNKRMQQHESAMFDRIDTNKDGSISRSEFEAAQRAGIARRRGAGRMHAAGAHSVHDAMVDRMLASDDANKDGRVSLQEATTAAVAHFDRIDTNHDGVLEPNEIRAAHKGARGKGGKR